MKCSNQKARCCPMCWKVTVRRWGRQTLWRNGVQRW